MDQEQPTVWPPAPKGMEPTPNLNVSTFKPAPTQWVIGLTALVAADAVIRSLCSLALAIYPRHSLLVTVNTVLSQSSGHLATVAFAAFLVWFYRVYKNLTAFDATNLRSTASWAVGWFFIPIFSLFRPYQMAQTIWKASLPDIDSRNAYAWQHASNGGVIIGWWWLTLLTEIMSVALVVDIFVLKAPRMRYDVDAAVVAMLSAATNVMIIFFIRAVSARQQEKEVARFWSA